MIRVYHMQNDWTRDDRWACGYGDAAKSDARRLFDAGRYRLVAQVDVVNLDDAYRLTQNIEGSWSRDDDPRIAVKAPLFEHNGKVFGLKSSEAGDLFELAGRLYLCARVGWAPIGAVVEAGA